MPLVIGGVFGYNAPMEMRGNRLRQYRHFLGIVLLTGLVSGVSLCRAGRLTDLSDSWYKNGKDILNGFQNMYSPHIIYEEGESYPYKMWFHGWANGDCNPGYSGCDAIFHARSQDLQNWEVYSGPAQWNSDDSSVWVPVVTAQTETWDNDHNGDPSVVKKDGVYYMAYSATGMIPGPEFISCVVGATSADGINWTKSSDPILINWDDYPNAPINNNHNYGDYHRPSLMFDEGKWKCWFDYWHPSGGTTMGYAECPENSFMDAAAWQVIRAGTNPALLNWPNPDVAKAGGVYYSYSDAVGYGEPGWYNRKITEAVSSDGMNWTPTGHIEPGVDEPTSQVPEAIVLNVSGRTLILIYYAVQGGGDPSGGGPDYEWRYKRMRYMWRPVYADYDINEDTIVDLQDFAVLASEWQLIPAGVEVALTNHSFESPTLGEGDYDALDPLNPDPYDWIPNAYNLARIYNPAASELIANAADGRNYLDVDGAVQINKDVQDETVKLNTVYTLTADVAVPSDAPNGPENAWVKMVQSSDGSDLAVYGGIPPVYLSSPYYDDWYSISCSFNSYKTTWGGDTLSIFLQGDRLVMDNFRLIRRPLSPSDINRDGWVSNDDLLLLVAHWLEGK